MNKLWGNANFDFAAFHGLRTRIDQLARFTLLLGISRNLCKK
jgi:hypothetical protein